MAELARISPTAVAALEAGRRRAPRLTTVALLSDALGLDEREQQELVSAARGGATIGDLSLGGSPSDRDPRANSSAAVVTSLAFLEPIGGWQHRFVGRGGELERLISVLGRRRRVVLVVGEAGIGKTRLIDHFAKRSAAMGVRVLCGGWTPGGLSPFAGFIEPLRQATSLVDLSLLSGNGELARLLPELTPQLGPADTPTHLDAEVERRQLFGAVAELLKAVGPTLLLLDDAQWADRASLALLFALATDPTLNQLVLMATIRANDLVPEMAAWFVDLERRSDVERLYLSALPPPELEELIIDIFGDDSRVDPEVVVRLARLSEGNPFFAQELAEQLLSAGTDGLSDLEAATSLPDRIRDTLKHRLVVLSPDTQALLRAGAVLGREFDPLLAGRLVELDTGRTIAATEDALLSGLVVEASAARLSFSHALVQAAVELDLASLRRVDLHRRAAVELEAMEPGGEVVAADLARHWAGVSAVDRQAAPKAAHWAVRAGNAAIAAAATEEAIASYQRAAELWSNNTAEHAATLIRLGTALYSCGRISEADAQFKAALHLAQALGDPHLQAQAAIGLARTLVMGRVDPVRVAALESALEVLDHDDPILRPLALAMLIRQLTFERSSSLRRRDEVAAEIHEILSRPDLPTELLLSLGSIRDFVGTNDPDVLDRLTRRTISVGRQHHDLVVQANAWWGQAWSALERGDAEDWRLAVAEHAAATEALGLQHELAHAARIRCTAAQIEGRFDDADRYSDDAAALGNAAHDPSADMLHTAQKMLLGMDEGRADALLTVQNELVKEYQAIPSFRAGLALVAAMAGEHPLAQRLLDEQAVEGFSRIHFDVEWLAVVTFYAHSACLVGARDHALELYPLLHSSASRGVRVGSLVGWWGPVDHHLGMLCRLVGNLSKAKQHLQRAVQIETAFRAEPFLARTQVALAEVLEHTGG